MTHGDDHRLGAIMRTMAFAALALTACGSQPAKQAASPPPTAQQIRQSVQESAEGCSTAVSAMIDALTTGNLAVASGKAQDTSTLCGGAHRAITLLVGTDEDGAYSDCVGMTLLGKALGDKTTASLADMPNTDAGLQRLAENYRSSAALCLIAVKKVT